MKPFTASHFLQNETPSPEPGGPGPLQFDPRLPHSCPFTCSFHLHRLNLPYIIRFPTSVPLFVPPPSPTMLSSSHDFLKSTNLANIRQALQAALLNSFTSQWFLPHQRCYNIYSRGHSHNTIKIPIKFYFVFQSNFSCVYASFLSTRLTLCFLIISRSPRTYLAHICCVKFSWILFRYLLVTRYAKV